MPFGIDITDSDNDGALYEGADPFNFGGGSVDDWERESDSNYTGGEDPTPEPDDEDIDDWERESGSNYRGGEDPTPDVNTTPDNLDDSAGQGENLMMDLLLSQRLSASDSDSAQSPLSGLSSTQMLGGALILAALVLALSGGESA